LTPPVGSAEGSAADPLSVLARIRNTRPRERPRPGERCDLCATPIPDEHEHVVDLEQRNLLCTCHGCFLLLAPDGAGGLRYRAVPDRYLAFPDFELSPGQWDSLQIPVSVAFFFVNSSLERVAAFYPSPAGATESLLPLDTWDDIVTAHPDLATLLPDVEAFLVRSERPGAGTAECYLVPIDACYEMVGQLRRLWRGFDGGQEAHDALDAFFDRIRTRAQLVRTGEHRP
jgi:uncharacterized protein DUF5947